MRKLLTTLALGAGLILGGFGCSPPEPKTPKDIIISYLLKTPARNEKLNLRGNFKPEHRMYDCNVYETELEICKIRPENSRSYYSNFRLELIDYEPFINGRKKDFDPFDRLIITEQEKPTYINFEDTEEIPYMGLELTDHSADGKVEKAYLYDTYYDRIFNYPRGAMTNELNLNLKMDKEKLSQFYNSILSEIAKEIESKKTN